MQRNHPRSRINVEHENIIRGGFNLLRHYKILNFNILKTSLKPFSELLKRNWPEYMYIQIKLNYCNVKCIRYFYKFLLVKC